MAGVDNPRHHPLQDGSGSARSRRRAFALARVSVLVGLVLVACFGVARLGLAATPAAAGTGAPSSAASQPREATGLEAELARQARQLVDAGTATARAPGIERVEVEIGRLDPRLNLAPCESIQAYLPKGTRLLGRSHVGLRCERGTVRWNVYLPVTVRVWTQALVATSALPAGSEIDPTRLALAPVDLGAERGMVYGDLASLAGRSLLRPVAAGQAVRSTVLRPRQWFAAGETVRILASGGGFSVRASGEALSPGIEGRAVRVRTEGGRVVTGLPVADQTVEVAL